MSQPVCVSPYFIILLSGCCLSLCQCCESGMFIQDLGSDFFIPDFGSRVDKIQDPRSGFASKNLSIFNPKTDRYLVLKNKIQDVNHGYRILALNFSLRIPDPDPGSKGQKSTGYWTRIQGSKSPRNTALCTPNHAEKM